MAWKDRTIIQELKEDEINRIIESNEVVFLLQNSLQNNGRNIHGPLKFSRLIGIGVHKSFSLRQNQSINALLDWTQAQNDIIFAAFGYDLKNKLENLKSRSPNAIGFSDIFMVVPETVVIVNGDEIECFTHLSELHIPTSVASIPIQVPVELESQTYDKYISNINALKEHIQLGDVYEVNYCIEHKLREISLNPYRLYGELQQTSPAPFACYVAQNRKYLISSSPERFMMKQGQRIISQPMKGTNRKTSNNEEQKAILKSDAKELAENIMITDLVRNDLSRSAKKGSVLVDELCGVYEYEHVNAMVSTVSAQLREDIHPIQALLNAFPMGSMTGAPKIRAMELIDEYEDFSRGLFSGAVGYFTPEMDFDFNVIIRSILYNSEEKIATFPTGSAITINSIAEKEYEECLLKAEAMLKVLRNHAS